jgi:hypothetical protein
MGSPVLLLGKLLQTRGRCADSAGELASDWPFAWLLTWGAGLADKMAVAGYTRCAGKLRLQRRPTARQLVWAFFTMI